MSIPLVYFAYKPIKWEEKQMQLHQRFFCNFTQSNAISQ